MNPAKLLREYAAVVATVDEPDTWHVLGMIVKMREMLGAGEHLKLCRWLGYVQCWMEAKGLRTLAQLRDETRGIDDALIAALPEPPSADRHRLARTLYETYCDDRGWRSERGDPFPQWCDLRYGEKSHWLAVADAAVAAKVVT